MAERLRELLRMMEESGLGGGNDSDSDDSSNDGSESGSSAGPRSRSSSNSSAMSDSRSKQRMPSTFADLKKQFEAFMEEPERPFRPGDIVMWKEGCSNKKRPKADEPAVVLEVFDEPLYGKEKSSGSPYFHEPMDIVLGLFDSDGDLTRYMYDKRRFRLAVQPDQLEGDSPAEKMRMMAVEYNKPCQFQVGDVVMLKPGFRHRRIPDYNTVAVVAEIFDKPFRDVNAEEGTSSFYELINGRIALFDNSGDLLFLHVDLRRYRKVN